MCVTSNLTIDDGLEVEVDKKMTSLGAAALPQHRLRSSVTLDCSLRLLACLRAVSRRRRQRQVTGYSNFASSVHKTLCRRRLHSHSQFLEGGRLLATLSHRLLTFFLKLFHLSVALNCDTSCTRFYLAASFTAARSPLSIHCCNFVTAWKRFADVQTLLLQPVSVRKSVDLFFYINVCDIELDDRRRA
jgi:hypothetical protein